MELKKEIMRIKNNAQSLRNQQNILYVNTKEAWLNADKLNETTRECAKKIAEHKKSLISLPEDIDNLNKENAKLKKKINEERKINDKYKELIRLIKEAIISTKKKIVNIKGKVTASANKCNNLKEKYDKESSFINKMYDVIT